MREKADISFRLEGLSCAGCVSRVEHAASSVKGVSSATASLATGFIKVSGTANPQDISEAIAEAGYPTHRELVLASADDLTCGGCVARLETALAAITGVDDVNVNLADKSIRLRAHSWVSRDKLSEAAKAAGYPIRFSSGSSEQSGEIAEARELGRKTFIAAFVTLPVFAYEMTGHAIPAFHHWAMTLFGAQPILVAQFLLIGFVLFFPGRRFFLNGFSALRRFAPDMNTLVAIGAGSAFTFSTVTTFASDLLPEASRDVYFESAGVIITLILLGRWLEARAKRQTGTAVRGLLRLTPRTARVVFEYGDENRALEDIQVGDVIRVRPGERLAADGVIVEGQSYIDESMISGEPLPVAKSSGDSVIGGTLNAGGGLSVRVSKTGADTMLAGIIRKVQEAQSAKLPIQSIIDRITLWFVPAVLAISCVTFVVWLLAGGTLSQAVVASVSVLIIACPCAMGLATPVSVIVGIGRAAELGALFRNGSAMQRLAEIRTIGFDKTGTLTVGQPEIRDVLPLADETETSLMKLAAAVEAGSEHPISKAVLAASPQTLAGTEFQSLPGKGAVANVDGVRIWVGNRALMRSNQVDLTEAAEWAHSREVSGGTVIFVSSDTELLGAISIGDTVKPDAKNVVSAFEEMGIRQIMLTGDAELTARKVGEEIGIKTVEAEADPEHKAKYIADLVASAPFAFVGDGINDAPALAAADVGISVGTGTDVAIETADVVLTSGRLGAILSAHGLAKATLRNIRQNLFWAFGYNVILIPVAAGALYPIWGITLSPMLAAGAMALSSVAVVTNALRLRSERGDV